MKCLNLEHFLTLWVTCKYVKIFIETRGLLDFEEGQPSIPSKFVYQKKTRHTKFVDQILVTPIVISKFAYQ